MRAVCFLLFLMIGANCLAQEEAMFRVKKIYKESSLDSLLKVWIEPGIDTLDEKIYSFVENAAMKEWMDEMECDYCNFSSDGKGKVYFTATSNKKPVILKFYKKDADNKKWLTGVRTFQTYFGIPQGF